MCRMGKALTPKRVVHYTFLLAGLWLAYRCYVTYQQSQQPGGGGYRAYGPRDIGQGRQGVKIQEAQDRRSPVDLDSRLHDLHRQDTAGKQGPGHANSLKRRPEAGAGGDGGDRQHPQQRHDKRQQDQSDKQKLYPDGEKRLGVRDPRDGELNKGERAGGGKRGGRHDEMSLRKKEREVGRGKADDDNKGKEGEKLKFDAKDSDVLKANADDLDKEKDKEVDHFQMEPKVDWALEEKLQKRRKKYLEEVAKRAEKYNPDDFKDILEHDDHLAFVTAATDSSWRAVQQFVYSVQYFYPNSDIGIYDLGISQQHRTELESYCRVSVIPTYIQLWPPHLRDIKKGLWRPLIWQMGLAHYGHMVYMEPERFLQAKHMKDYIEHSRRSGITVVGRRLPYSPFVVTNPEMFYFLSVDTRKLQRVGMFDITMLIMHNSEPVRHEFMRHLLACALEEYCIAPPGSKLECNHRLFAGSKKYADCHRYEMSAVNILLQKWFQFRTEAFLVRDIATAPYDGQDVSKKIKVCPPSKPENDEM